MITNLIIYIVLLALIFCCKKLIQNRFLLCRITLGILASGILFLLSERFLSVRKKYPFLQSGFEHKSQLTLKCFTNWRHILDLMYVLFLLQKILPAVDIDIHADRQFILFGHYTYMVALVMLCLLDFRSSLYTNVGHTS